MATATIEIATEFTGKKAFKQAETSTEKLSKGVKNLARNLGLAFGTAAVVNYAKKSVRAAADDQKAQTQLALALKNVGLERDAASTEQYINRLETEFGVLDDLLRPAYQKLAVATKSSAESQRLLNLSLDIAASTGKDVNAVATALSRAYLGTNTALTRLGVGLTKADLKTKSFEEITNQLADTFSGSASAAAQTFSGQLAILSVGAANASEIIGTGLIDALTELGENTSAADLANNMKLTATYIADVIRGVGTLGGKLNEIPIIGDLNVGMIPILGSYLELLREAGKTTTIRNPNEHMARAPQLKAERESIKLTKTSNQLKKIDNDATTRKIVLTGDQLALAELEKKFDLERIGLYAALNQTTDSETKMRLLSLIAIQDQNSALAGMIKKANEAENAFATLIEALRATIRSMLDSIKPQVQQLQAQIYGPNTPIETQREVVRQKLDLAMPDITALQNLLASQGVPGYSRTSFETPNVTVNVTGSVTTERDLVAAITQGLYAQQASGTPVNYSTAY
jgi:predicted  nucleic acid-binding Zn-ribbon protein